MCCIIRRANKPHSVLLFGLGFSLLGNCFQIENIYATSLLCGVSMLQAYIYGVAILQVYIYGVSMLQAHIYQGFFQDLGQGGGKAAICNLVWGACLSQHAQHLIM